MIKIKNKKLWITSRICWFKENMLVKSKMKKEMGKEFFSI